LSKWLNDSIQKRLFSEQDWFVREWDAWRRSLRDTAEPSIEPSTESKVDQSAPPLAAEVEPVAAQVEPTDATLMLFRGVTIRMRGERGSEQLCLTDMFRAVGDRSKKAPSDWLKLDTNQGFIEHLTETLGERFGFSAEKGGPAGGGATWAHWQLAFAYAKFLSPSFHAWVNQAAREKLERGRAHAPALAPEFPSWARALLEGLGSGVSGASAKAAAAEETAVNARALAEQADRRAAHAERLALEASKAANGSPNLPPLPSGWRLVRDVAEQNGLPCNGPGGKVIQSICQSIPSRPFDDDSMVRRVFHRGARSLALSPICCERLRPAFFSAARMMREHGYQVRGSVMVPRDDLKPRRSPAWVAQAMLIAALADSSPQIQLRAIQGGVGA
jgi:hypothetical protein